MKANLAQTILSRLYTDAKFRSEFTADKAVFCKKNNLTSEEEIHFIDSLSADQITFFAEGLKSKRLHEVRNLIPITSRLLEKRMKDQFGIYAADKTPAGIHKHHDDAIQFGNFLFQTESDPFLKSVLKFELKRLQNFVTAKRVSISVHPYNFGKDYTALLKNPGYHAKKKFTIILWKNGKILKTF
jgi:hypothetical protein